MTVAARVEPVYQHTRWNFGMFIAEATLYMAGLTWVDSSAVLPLFVGRLGGSTIIVGFVAAMQQLGWKVPQVFMAAALGHRPRKLPFLRWPILIGIIPLLGLVAYLWTAGTDRATVVLSLVVIAFTSLSLANGVLGISWQDIIAKSIPPRWRGRFFGTMHFTTAVTAFAIGFAVRAMLGPGGPGFPRGYTVLFTASGVFMVLCTVGCWLVREPVRPALDQPQSVGEILRGTLPMLREEPAFRALVTMGLLVLGVSTSMPFYVVYAKRALGVTDAAAGTYISAMTLGGAIASPLWGHLNDRHGPRSVLRGTACLIAATPLLALLVPAGVRALPALTSSLPSLFGLVFLAAGSSMNAIWFGASNYLLELTGDEDRPRYIGVYHLCTLPAALGALLIGWLLSRLPFGAVFLLVAASGAGAVVTAWRMPESGLGFRVSGLGNGRDRESRVGNGPDGN
jgi:MFS family permease